MMSPFHELDAVALLALERAQVRPLQTRDIPTPANLKPREARCRAFTKGSEWRRRETRRLVAWGKRTWVRPMERPNNPFPNARSRATPARSSTKRGTPPLATESPAATRFRPPESCSHFMRLGKSAELSKTLAVCEMIGQPTESEPSEPTNTPVSRRPGRSLRPL